MIILLESTQAIQDEFVFSSWEQIWKNLDLHLLLTNGSAVNGCRHHKNITTLHTTKVHKLTSTELKSDMFVRHF